MADKIGLYADARIYDILHTPGTAEEVDGLVRTEALFSHANSHSRLWLEPACGTGRYLRVARARGINCLGFDLSADMIDYARTRAARASSNAHERYFVASMCDFARDIHRPVSFAFNLINTIRHLDSDTAMLEHFEQIAQVLSPKGIYAVGVSLSHYGQENPSEDVWKGARGPCRVRQVVRFTPPTRGRKEQVDSRLTVTTPTGRSRHKSTYFLRTYSQKQWLSLIARSHLRLVETVDPNGSPTPVPEVGYAVFLLGPAR
jgi:SAM-dependent methyltransferase